MNQFAWFSGESPPVGGEHYTRIFTLVQPIASELTMNSRKGLAGLSVDSLDYVVILLTQIAVPAVRIIPRGWGSAFAIDARFELARSANFLFIHHPYLRDLDGLIFPGSVF